MGQVNLANVHDVISYHAPTEHQLEMIAKVRHDAETLIATILQAAPSCADQTAAVRKVREAMMTANAAIVLNGAV